MAKLAARALARPRSKGSSEMLRQRPAEPSGRADLSLKKRGKAEQKNLKQAWLVLRNVCAHNLQRMANAAPELSNVGGCLAERVLQAIQCGALLPEVALHVRNAFMCVVCSAV